jgi:thiol-disulfide isomerase/thioredoxin
MSQETDSDLLEFYGTECAHCKKMEPLIERFEIETHLKIKKLEVWHNEANANLLKQYDNGNCGGVPFFYNKKTGKWLCGVKDYDTFKNWALGK